MTVQSLQMTVNVEDFLKLLEPLIRRVVREELTELVKNNAHIFHLEPNTPLYADMQEILQRKAEGEIKLYSHEEVWDG